MTQSRGLGGKMPVIGTHSSLAHVLAAAVVCVFASCSGGGKKVEWQPDVPQEVAPDSDVPSEQDLPSLGVSDVPDSEAFSDAAEVLDTIDSGELHEVDLTDLAPEAEIHADSV